jgi:hypothetical protein
MSADLHELRELALGRLDELAEDLAVLHDMLGANDALSAVTLAHLADYLGLARVRLGQAIYLLRRRTPPPTP